MKKLLVILSIAIVSVFFIKCGNNNEQPKKADTKNSLLTDTVTYNKYLKQGSEFAMNTGGILIKNVTEAIAKKGTEYAMEFCNTKALPLTDSMASVQNTFIKRVTDKARNQLNKANAEELQYIQQLKSMMTAGQKPKPQLQEVDEKIISYYPIITSDMCMQCHGDKSVIEAKALAKINKLYPADSATGYKSNELRGLWVVKMMKEKQSN